MAEFIFTSAQFEGSLRFRYDERGVLEQFECKALLTDKQMAYFTNHFPFRLEFLQLIEKSGSGKLIETTDLRFETFWDLYDHKRDKIKAQKCWEKLSKADKALALGGIYRYKNKCIMAGIAQVYPERYLKYKRWEDEE